jgi:hypothetical protein
MGEILKDQSPMLVLLNNGVCEFIKSVSVWILIDDITKNDSLNSILFDLNNSVEPYINTISLIV